MTASPPARALFLRRGAFSHTNDRLIDALRRQAPEFDFVDLDVERAFRRSALATLRCVAAAIGDYGVGSLRSRALLRHRFSKTLAYMQACRAVVAEAVGAARYAFTLQTQSLFNGAVGAGAAGGSDRPRHLVYTDHVALAAETAAWNALRSTPTAAWRAAEAAIYLDADHVFTFGSAMRRMLIEDYGVAPERVSVAGSGANVTPSEPPTLDLARYARRKILFVGVEWERKGGPVLLEAFARLRARLPDATLTIVGCDPQAARDVPGVEVLGRLPTERVQAQFQAASCLCVPTRLEPFGIVFVEAAHFGLPAVGTRVGDVGDVVRDGETGWRVPRDDPEALAEALLRTLADPAVARRMGEAALGRAADHAWDRVAARILAQADPARRAAGDARPSALTPSRG